MHDIPFVNGENDELYPVCCIHCVSKKNIPDVFSYNSTKHWRIFI